MCVCIYIYVCVCVCVQEDILDSSQLKVLRFKSAKESLVDFINVYIYIWLPFLLIIEYFKVNTIFTVLHA